MSLAHPVADQPVAARPVAVAPAVHAVEMPQLLVVGLSVQASWQALWVQMPDAWERFKARYAEVPHRAQDVLMDVSLDRADGTYHQLLGVAVTHVDAVPAGMTAVRIPAQRYLHLRHQGPLHEIAGAFGRLHDAAKVRGLGIDDFKLDVGYAPWGDDGAHDLYVRLLPALPWEDVTPA